MPLCGVHRACVQSGLHRRIRLDPTIRGILDRHGASDDVLGRMTVKLAPFSTLPPPIGSRSKPSRGARIHSDKPVASLSIKELEAGLEVLARADVDECAFWDQNVGVFRQTVLLAIRETSDALLSSRMSDDWRSDLEAQLEALVQYVDLADRYIGQLSLRRGRRKRFN